MRDWSIQLNVLLRGALRWWLGELAGLIPDGLRRQLAALRSRLLLVIDAQGNASLVYEAGARREWIGRLDLEDDDPAALRRLLTDGRQRRGSRSASVVVSLPPTRVLRPLASLPLAAERNLDQVIGFEFDRLVPFKRDEVYLSYRVRGRDKAARTLQLELTVVPRADLQNILRQAQRLGLRVVGVEVSSASPAGPAVPIALDGRDRPAAYRRERIALAALAGLTSLLAVAAVLVPLLRAEATRGALAARLAVARRNADASLDLRKEIETEIRGQNFLIERKERIPTVTGILDTLTRLTPDNTWLTELLIGDGKVHLIGATTSATALLALIDRSPRFRNAAFQASITQDSRIDRERFDIEAQIVPKTKP